MAWKPFFTLGAGAVLFLFSQRAIDEALRIHRALAGPKSTTPNSMDKTSDAEFLRRSIVPRGADPLAHSPVFANTTILLMGNESQVEFKGQRCNRIGGEYAKP